MAVGTKFANVDLNQDQSGTRTTTNYDSGSGNWVQPVRLVGSDIIQPVDSQSILRSQAVLTTTALGANAAYTSSSTDGINYRRVTGRVYADQAGATSGLQIQQSDDGSTWDTVWSQASPAASTVYAFDVELYLRYVRVVYTNGAGAQTTFRLSMYLSVE